jgi:DNA-binding NarL/FixJ family response regulator
MSIRILIADDQSLVRTGFRMILDAEPDLDVVGEAVDGREAVDKAKAAKPDVILMDIRMPDLDGIEATRRIVADGGEEAPKILMLTTFDLNEYVYEALRAGASGFLLKDVPAEQLADGVRVVAAGEALLAPSVTRRLLAEFAQVRPRDAAPPPAFAELTPRELEVSGDAAVYADHDAEVLLLGTRERIALFGGELHAGRRRGGGWSLRARLPLQEGQA